MLQEKIIKDWKEALKAKSHEKDVLSMIITELKNRAIKDNIKGEAGRMVTDEVAITVLQKMAKQRKESIESYKNANRLDLAQKEEAELKVIERYLPKPLSDDELKKIVSDVIKKVGASSKKDIGKVMGAAIKETASRADGKRIQKVAMELLSD